MNNGTMKKNPNSQFKKISCQGLNIGRKKIIIKIVCR